MNKVETTIILIAMFLAAALGAAMGNVWIEEYSDEVIDQQGVLGQQEIICLVAEQKDEAEVKYIQNVLIGNSSLSTSDEILPTTLKVGTRYWINWDSENIKSIGIVLEKDGESVRNLIWNLYDNGGITWTPDNSIAPGDRYQIVVLEDGGNGVSDTRAKSSYFTIE